MSKKKKSMTKPRFSMGKYKTSKRYRGKQENYTRKDKRNIKKKSKKWVLKDL